MESVGELQAVRAIAQQLTDNLYRTEPRSTADMYTLCGFLAGMYTYKEHDEIMETFAVRLLKAFPEFGDSMLSDTGNVINTINKVLNEFDQSP